VTTTSPETPQADLGSSRTLWLSARDVECIFHADDAFESQRLAFTALGNGTGTSPDKVMLGSPTGDSTAFCYTAQLSAEFGPICKFGAVHPDNRDRGLPTVSAVLIALDPHTGRVAAIMDGATITTRRTAAASALATSLLANESASRLTILGCGVQGREHARAISRVRHLSRITVWSPDLAESTALAASLQSEVGITVDATRDAREAVAAADIVTTCTTSHSPVLLGEWLTAGTTVLSVGSFEPDRCEVDGDTLDRASRIVVDQPTSAARHAGPIVRAIHAGTLREQDLIGLGDCLVGRVAGRSASEDIIFYNSTGLGIQDAAAASVAVRRATEAGISARMCLT
jgi:ornithine cyclodeaminase